FNGLHRKNCCGTEVNHTEICCDGHRRSGHRHCKHMYCCGNRAYNIKNQQMKCCSGTLYNLTLFNVSKHEVQCCGSALQNKQDVCCLGEDMEVLYSAKEGFRCCAHHYYNTSLWSCCEGRLSPRRHQNRMITESTLLTMDNLTETQLCKEILIGIVASVSQHQRSIAFNNVLKIHGRNGTLTPLASPHILNTPTRCNFPKVTLGKTYFFDRVNMYTDFNHDSILQSIHFIFTTCSYHEVTAG
ncbi:Usherin, partial [Larimichthys crocea]